MDPFMLLVLSGLACYIYAFVSGFTDAGQAIASAIGSRSLSPFVAVLMAGVLEVVGALSLALLGSSSIVSGFLENALSLPGFAAGQLILVFSAASGLASVFLIVWTCLTAAARRLRAAGLVALVYGGLAALGSVVFMVNVSSIKGGKLAPLVGLMFCAGAAVFILGVAVILLGYRVLKASGRNC